MATADRHAPVRFLRTLFEPTDWVAIFLKSYDRSAVAQRVGPVSWIQSERFQRWLRAMNAAKYNVFVSVNVIASGRRSRTREAIGAVRHVFLDADHDGPAVLSRVEARRDLPIPSYVLHSSPNHIHVFWRVTGFDNDLVERLQKQLAHELQTDPAATPVTQNTRLPGFFNHKAVSHVGAAGNCWPTRRRPYVSRLLPARQRVRAGRGPGATRAVGVEYAVRAAMVTGGAAR